MQYTNLNTHIYFLEINKYTYIHTYIQHIHSTYIETYIDILHMYIHIPHITIYIGYMGLYKLQYLHIHIHTQTLDICILTHT